MKQKEIISLKQVSNTTLLDMYYEYRSELTARTKNLATAKKLHDKFSEEWLFEKIKELSEQFFQIKNEVLSRMMGMEID